MFLQQILTIAHNTFVESIRQPIFVVLVMVGALFLVLNPQLAAYSMEVGGGDNKMLVDLGLSTLFLVGLLLAAFTATGVLSSEVENKTVLTVVSKPVARPSFVVGKFVGVAAAIALAYFCLAIVFVFTIRHRVMSTASDQFDMPVVLFGVGAFAVALFVSAWGNYFYRWVFTSTFMTTLAATLTLALCLVLVIDKHWEMQSPLAEFQADEGRLTQIAIGLLLVLEAVFLLTAVAVAASTRLGQVMTLVVCLGVFALGLVTNSMSAYVNERVGVPATIPAWDSINAIFASEPGVGLQLVYLLVKLGYVVLPNLQFLWPADAITQGNPFSLEHVGTVSAYALLYVGVVLGVAVTLFQTREVG